MKKMDPVIEGQSYLISKSTGNPIISNPLHIISYPSFISLNIVIPSKKVYGCKDREYLIKLVKIFYDNPHKLRSVKDSSQGSCFSEQFLRVFETGADHKEFLNYFRDSFEIENLRFEDEILNHEKVKFRIFYLAYCISKCWFGQMVEKVEVNNFEHCLSDLRYLRAVPIMLESFRIFNKFEVSPPAFKQMSCLMSISLKKCLKLHDIEAPMTLMNMASTYYMYKVSILNMNL